MAQLTVYIDEETLKKIEKAALGEGASISKWVKRKLTEVMESRWPRDYFQLFGSLAGERLRRPDSLHVKDDAKRERL